MENKEKLPPKRGPLDKLITKPADITKVVIGQKVATRRNGRFADFGEKWSLVDTELIAKNVYRQKLGEVSDEDAVMEDYQNLEEYKESIFSFYPRMNGNQR